MSKKWGSAKKMLAMATAAKPVDTVRITNHQRLASSSQAWFPSAKHRLLVLEDSRIVDVRNRRSISIVRERKNILINDAFDGTHSLQLVGAKITKHDDDPKRAYIRLSYHDGKSIQQGTLLLCSDEGILINPYYHLHNTDCTFDISSMSSMKTVELSLHNIDGSNLSISQHQLRLVFKCLDVDFPLEKSDYHFIHSFAVGCDLSSLPFADRDTVYGGCITTILNDKTITIDRGMHYIDGAKGILFRDIIMADTIDHPIIIMNTTEGASFTNRYKYKIELQCVGNGRYIPKNQKSDLMILECNQRITNIIISFSGIDGKLLKIRGPWQVIINVMTDSHQPRHPQGISLAHSL